MAPGCYLYSRDMARAYRQLRSDPLDWPLTGLTWNSKYYFDMSVPFVIRQVRINLATLRPCIRFQNAPSLQVIVLFGHF